MRDSRRLAPAGTGALGFVEMLRLVTGAVILASIALAIFLTVEAIGAPLAGWASAQAFASLAPV